ncbi:hypothetical protein FNV66_38580 [Streptomyces sp. S1D4-14]|nr:hypothetical protein FNV67_39720 [Streptomyces sp. S1D4-20]QDN70663.1 hypothetical protein FNV66_38580 [Streptomyces sp. S1D4-14]QDN80957.1 hypothetical protein FNV64_40060 [Streptomyces sp. S1A1-7]QDO53118.1 hypothetical protein FNV60_37065 [Streptomyces sp. RLB3-5]QDO63362.1 hypothetical protein FNV59_39315 [Streptomyces sp. RLB1-8]
MPFPASVRSVGARLSARPAFEDEAVQADRGSGGAAPRDGMGRGGGGETRGGGVGGSTRGWRDGVGADPPAIHPGSDLLSCRFP